MSPKPQGQSQRLTLKVPVEELIRPVADSQHSSSANLETGSKPDATHDAQIPMTLPALEDLNTRPQTATATADIGGVYKLIRMSVTNHFSELGRDHNEAFDVSLLARTRPHSDLLDIVFGKGHKDLAFTLSNIFRKQALPTSVLIRAFISAAIYTWIFKPNLLGSDIDHPELNAEGQILTGLLQVLEDKLSEGHVNQFKHQAAKVAIEHKEQELKARAQGLARKLYITLNDFFRTEQVDYTSNIRDGSELRPLPEDEAPNGIFPADRPPLPLPDRGWIYGEDRFYSGTNTFESRSVEIFEKSLDLRKSWEIKWDAQLTFDFPIMGAEFQERVHVNEQATKTGKKKKARTAAADEEPETVHQVFICMFPGVSAQIRPAYDQDYGDRVLLSRAPVIMLDQP